MADYDLVVIGGGPAGYSAALAAAGRGAITAMVEAEKPGGACVHHACIPTAIMLSAVDGYLNARELDAVGVFASGDQFNYARAAARNDVLVRTVSEHIEAALRLRKVQLLGGRAAFVGPDRISVTGSETIELSAEAFVIASGSRWEPPALAGIAAGRVVTADAVQSLVSLPASALILGGGPADSAFALEYAFLLAAAGAAVTLAVPSPHLLPALDPALADIAATVLTDLGVTILLDAVVEGGDDTAANIRHRDGVQLAPAGIIIAVDNRRPFFEGLNLAAAGVHAEGGIPVDRACRTNMPQIFAAGDVTGGPMLTNAALQMGEVAGINASGGEVVTRLAAIPHLLHTQPQIGWIGLTEAQARAEGYDVRTGSFDLAYNARSITLGARQGLVKLVTERSMGQIIGVHVVGPEASELLAVVATAMQAEMTVDDLAVAVHWHPSMAEALVAAARRAR